MLLRTEPFLPGLGTQPHVDERPHARLADHLEKLFDRPRAMTHRVERAPS